MPELTETTVDVSRTKPSHIVGVGASAGGLDALERLFDNVPEDSGLAFVVVQHLSPDFKSLMAELLARHTTIPIHRVEEGMQLEANAIYLIPPKKNMVLDDDRLRLTEQDKSSLNLPIDIFFKSLADAAGEKAIAVVLSGTGSDGSRGIKAVHEAGGLVVVQSMQSAAFDGMPRSALGTGLAGVICPPDNMSSRILEYVKAPSTFATDDEREAEEDCESTEMAVIFRLFRNQYGIDFSYYKLATIKRRLERRVKLSRCNSLSDYLQKLDNDARELDILYRDLLVEVTQFFRDLEAFQRLRDIVVPQIVENANPQEGIRIWIPGCATGEEAYSVAMLFDDYLNQHETSIDFKLFATDVHQTSLEMASAGVYSSNSVAQMPIEYKDKFFTRVGDLYHVSSELRQKVIFAPHDITKDPPFTRIDLISCRNVLIYIEPEVQHKVLSLFHFGLKVGGTLIIGPSETVGELDREFEAIDRHWRIYRKIRDVRLATPERTNAETPLNRVVFSRPSFVSTQTRTEKNWLVPEVYDHLLARYVPPSLLINEHLELIHSFGEARRLLTQPEGKATLDVTRLVEGDLRVAMNAAIHKASSSDSTVVFKGVKVRAGDQEQPYRLIVEPLKKGSQKSFLISLEEIHDVQPTVHVDEDFDSADATAERVSSLERELDYTKETLQATVEELETSNEELQSTNEELVASNEELQSTNEELHSVNEELYTVNAEHQKKIIELTELTDDMDNLMKSIRIGTVFLDKNLIIRKFTPEITRAFHMIEQDIGRPIGHIAHRMKNFDLVGDAKRVIQNNVPIERGVESEDGEFYLIRVLPYETTGEVDGVVITFIDASTIAGLTEHLPQH